MSANYDYRDWVNFSDDGFCVMELMFNAGGNAVDGRFLEANPAFERHAGFFPKPGQTLRQLAPATELKWIESFVEVVRSGRPARYINSNSRGQWFEVHAYRVGSRDANRLAMFFRDVSEQMSAQADRDRLTLELGAALDALKEADRRKDEFIALLAHELRNPLAPLENGVNMLSLLVRSGQPVEPRALADIAGIMQRQLRHLRRLVDDLLDVRRISTGRLELKRAPLELGPLIAEAGDAGRSLFQARNISFSVRVPGQAIWVDGDAIRLLQVFENLLTNAAKFTDEGGQVEVSLDLANDNVVVSVRDDGIGIQTGNLERIFELFTQLDTSLGKAQGGLGIGLGLVQVLVQMHGGSVKAFSDGPGKGGEFRITLPVVHP